jgi:hypothetical protein
MIVAMRLFLAALLILVVVPAGQLFLKERFLAGRRQAVRGLSAAAHGALVLTIS